MNYLTENLAQNKKTANNNVCFYRNVLLDVESSFRRRAVFEARNIHAAIALFQSALDTQRSLRLHQDRCPRCTPTLIKPTAPQSLRLGSL